MTQHWAFARGGAWRNPKPSGGPYVCEQCRLNSCSGNEGTLTLQAEWVGELQEQMQQLGRTEAAAKDLKQQVEILAANYKEIAEVLRGV